ncbi:MAG TPA: hypothetical protein VJP80_06310 [Candidatus Saccharimonadales bacterium]|nr:hypothetical protein [Candidatus Saccharimonadales bacterium]
MKQLARPSEEVAAPDALHALAPYTARQPNDAAAYDTLYAAIAEMVDQHGYVPVERIERGFLRKKEKLVPAPIALSNGALVTARAVLWPNPHAVGYDVNHYPIRCKEFSMIPASYPYRGLLQTTAFYGARGNMAVVVADRIVAPTEGEPGRELYAVSAGFVKTNSSHEFAPKRTLLIARGAGNAVMRRFPELGSWQGMEEERVSPAGAWQIATELDVLLYPESPDMIAEEPGLSTFPDVSVKPSASSQPYTRGLDDPCRWWIRVDEAQAAQFLQA